MPVNRHASFLPCDEPWREKALKASASVKEVVPKYSSFRKLAIGSSARVLHLLLLTAMGFALTPFTIHRLGPEQYGIWVLANAFIGYYSLLDLGLSGAVFTHMSHAIGAQDYESGSRIYATGLSIFSALGGILVVASVGLAAFMLLSHANHGTKLAIVVLIVGIQTAVSFPMRAPFGALNAGSHFEATSLVLILSAILRTLGTVAVLRAGKGVEGLAVVNLLSWIPGYILICAAVHWTYPFIRARSPYQWHRPTAGRLLRFGIPVLVGQIADRIRLQTDVIIVSLFFGLSAVTHYNIATTLVMYYMDGIVAIIGVVTPILSMQMGARDLDGLKRSLFVGTRLAICAGGFVAFGLLAWGRAFIACWMGTPYQDAYPILAVLTLAMFLDLWQSTAVNALYATLHQKTYAKINIGEAAANGVLSILLARPFGMLGVAIGTLIPSIVVRVFIQPWIIESKLEIRARDYYLMSLRTALRTLLCLLVPLAITAFLMRPAYPSLILVGTLSLIVFVPPVWYFEFQMSGSDRIRSFIRQRLRRNGSASAETFSP
jgi:O-antigen/teichoic acid export membrane protein